MAEEKRKNARFRVSFLKSCRISAPCQVLECWQETRIWGPKALLSGERMAKKDKQCLDCDKKISLRAKRCKSCAGTARWKDPEHYRKHSRGAKAAWARGVYDNISEAIKAAHTRGAYDNPETRRKHAESIKAARARGVYDNPETRRKYSEATTARWARGDFDGNREAMKAAWARGVFDGKSEAMKAAWARGDRDGHSGAVKAAWANGSYDGVFGPPYKSTEVPLAAALDICGIEHTSQYRPEGHSRIYDEFVPPNILIEAHGDYWHGPRHPEYAERQARDAEKAMWAKENGYLLVVMWEHEIQGCGAWALVHERVLPLLQGAMKKGC